MLYRLAWPGLAWPGGGGGISDKLFILHGEAVYKYWQWLSWAFGNQTASKLLVISTTQHLEFLVGFNWKLPVWLLGEQVTNMPSTKLLFVCIIR